MEGIILPSHQQIAGSAWLLWEIDTQFRKEKDLGPWHYWFEAEKDWIRLLNWKPEF